MESVVVADESLAGPGLGKPVQAVVFLSDFPPFTLPFPQCIALHLLTIWLGQPGSHSFPGGDGDRWWSVITHLPQFPRMQVSPVLTAFPIISPATRWNSYGDITCIFLGQWRDSDWGHLNRFLSPRGRRWQSQVLKDLVMASEMLRSPHCDPFLLGKLYYDFLFSVKNVHIRFSFISVCCVYFSRRKVTYGLSFSLDLLLFL